MGRVTVKVVVDGQEYEFDNLLCCGCPTGENDNPTAFYFGHRDIGEMGVNTMYMLLSVLKICRTEMGFPRQVGEDFILECFHEAVRRDTYNRDEQTVTRRVFDQK
jgi:hypothetical protein